MTNPDLLSYAGAIAGAVGAVTGIAGSIMGYISYRRSGQLKALDLRLELRKSISDLSDELQELRGLLAHAKKSRVAVAAATGRTGSGAMQHWLAKFETDEKSIEPLAQAASKLNVDFSKSSHGELEAKLVEVHSQKATVTRLRLKYESTITDDNNDRDHIRQDIRARTGPPR